MSRFPLHPTTKRTGPKPVSTVSPEKPAIPPSGRIEEKRTLTANPKGFMSSGGQRRSYRNKRRVLAERILQLKMTEGLTHPEVAKRLGISTDAVGRYLYLAGKEGWFTTPDIEDHLTYVTSHKIVKNVDQQLAGDDLTPQQQEMTIAAAKGRGLFKVHESGKGEGPQQSLVLGVKIEVVQPGQHASTVQQTGVRQLSDESGVPAYQEGQLVASN